MDIIKGLVTKSKENIVSERTVDLLVWAKYEKFSSARDIYTPLKDQFNSSYSGYTLSRVTLNRKLIVAQVKKV